MPLLRLVTAIAEYGMGQGRAKVLFPKVRPSLHLSLHEFLNRALLLHLNASLPEHLDDILIGDMREFCHAGWEKVHVRERISFREFVSVWASFMFTKLRLSKRHARLNRLPLSRDPRW